MDSGDIIGSRVVITYDIPTTRLGLSGIINEFTGWVGNHKTFSVIWEDGSETTELLVDLEFIQGPATGRYDIITQSRV